MVPEGCQGRIVSTLEPGIKKANLSRSELGRGLQNVNHKCEKILLNMYYSMYDRKYMCSRKAAILVTEIKRATNLGTIIGFLKSKYDFGIDEIVKVKVLIEKQKVELLKRISEKCLHGQLFKALENPLVDVKESSAWLKSGNNSPQSEGLYCYLQDRNLFSGKNRGTCNHCHVKQKSVDHLATQCGRMLYHDYTWRHNEVVRCLHLKFCREFGILSNKKLKTHRVSGVVENSRVCIKIDIPIVTDIYVQYNMTI